MSRASGTGADHPTTVFLCVHKGASTFITADLVPAMQEVFRGLRHVALGQELVNGGSAADYPLPPRGLVVSRVYPHLYDELVEDPEPPGGRLADKKLVMLRRDPRDVAVSLYYSIRYSHTPKTRNPTVFQHRRERLEQLSLAEGIATVTHKGAVKQFLATGDFIERFPHTCVTTYERLVTDCPGWIEQVGAYLGWTGDQRAAIADRVAAAVEPPEDEDHLKHKRRVTPGNWQEVFDARLTRLFQRKLGSALVEAGYEW